MKCAESHMHYHALQGLISKRVFSVRLKLAFCAIPTTTIVLLSCVYNLFRNKYRLDKSDCGLIKKPDYLFYHFQFEGEQQQLLT